MALRWKRHFYLILKLLIPIDLRQSGSYYNTVLIGFSSLIIIFTGDQRQPRFFLVLHHRNVARRHNLICLHGKGIFLSVCVNNDLIAIFKCTQIYEWAWQAARQIDMTREHAISIPGWECAALQPSSFIRQPGNIPAAIFLWHAHDRDLYAKTRDLQGYVAGGCIGFMLYTAEVGDHAGFEARHRDQEGGIRSSRFWTGSWGRSRCWRGRRISSSGNGKRGSGRLVILCVWIRL